MRPRLTAALVEWVHRPIEDSGPDPDCVELTDEDFARLGESLLDRNGAGQDLWLFAYGSLIWNPACEVAEQRRGVAPGWHRSFCLRLSRWRGTPEQPGLMMALDRGGQCRGVLYRIPATHAAERLGEILRREMDYRHSNNVPCWLLVRTTDGPLRALGFAANRRHPDYAGRLPLPEVADILATAIGHWGSCAEYLYNTVEQLDAIGIRDANLWRLQEMVAERILAATS
ncbi:MAG: gamma-glutamylcyclotransferase [Geminicoccaceae bacterium]